jgi:hypothetical protein
MDFLRKVIKKPESIKDHPIHNPLHTKKPQIRLLVLHPGRFDDPVSCRLEICYLKRHPAYEALSYVWGDAVATLPIYVGSQRKRFEATTNLECALRHLRYSDRDRILWIDAICINQANDAEKSQQVRMMRKIFAGAERVLAWLGPETADGRVAVQTLRRLAEDRNLHLHIDLRDISRPSINENEGIKLGTWFHECQWWARIWTVQEYVAAKELIFIYGASSITRMSLYTFALNLLHHYSSCCAGFASLGSILFMASTITYEIELIEMIRSRELIPSFAELLAKFRGRQATKPEDKVFGLVGLAEDSDELIVEYGLSVAKAYERCTSTIIETSKSLDILTQVVLPREALIGSTPNHQLPVPSWVPNWAELIHPFTVRNYLNRSVALYLYSASGKKTCDFIESHDGLLRIEGVTWDSISSAGEVLDTEFYSINAPIFISWYRLAETALPSQDYISSGTLDDAFWRTLCTDYSLASTRTTERLKENHRAAYDRWWQLQLKIDTYGSAVGTEMTLESYLDNSPKEVLEFDGSVMTATCNRRFFISEKGYIGLAPSNAAPGDKIAILFGGKVPYILRRNEPQSSENSEATWTFVGDSYVHGIMDGEVIESLERGEVTKERITLK